MLNKAMIIGNLGSDPEMRYTAAGKAVTNFSVAVNRRYKSGDEIVEDTTWFRVSAWERLAEVTSEHLSKGSKVYVEGRIREPRIYTDQGGESRTGLEISANTVEFLSTSNSKKGATATTPVSPWARPPGRGAAPPPRRSTTTTSPGR